MPSQSDFSKTILLVDDEQEILDLLKDTLTSRDFTCIQATSAEQALEIIQQVQVDLIISDIIMPGMSGTEFIEHVATHWPHVLRILITSHADNETITQAIKSGCLHAFVKKPWEPDKLVRLVRDTLIHQDKMEAESSYPSVSDDKTILESYTSEASCVAESAGPQNTADSTYGASNQQRIAHLLFHGVTLNRQDAIIMMDSNYRITYWNNAAQRMFGYTADEAITRDLELILVEDQNYSDAVNQIMKLSSINCDLLANHTINLAARHRSGAVFPIKASVSAFQNENGWHIICFINDITTHKLAESSLRASEDIFHNVVEKNHIGILAVNRFGNCVFANQAAEDIIGKDRSNLIGKVLDYPLDFNHGSEIEITRDDGSYMVAEINVSRTLWKGSPASLIMLHDITARKEAELKAKEQEIKLQQIQKLESLGQMAAGIAHEINTPTQFIGDNSKYLQEAFKDIEQLLAAYDRLQDAVESGNKVERTASEARRLAEEIGLNDLRKEIPSAIEQSLQGVERVANIVKSMKYFSHPGKQEKELVDINASIECAVNISRSEWKYEADLFTEFDSRVQLAPCFSAEFNQAILNMIINSIHAIKEAKNTDPARSGEINIQTKRDGDCILISISDNGIGIPEENRSRIFDPFFTTKVAGVGTGQGLSLAYSTIVDRMGGAIEVISEPGKGTTFTIRLPATEHEHEPAAQISTKTASTL